MSEGEKRRFLLHRQLGFSVFGLILSILLSHVDGWKKKTKKITQRRSVL